MLCAAILIVLLVILSSKNTSASAGSGVMNRKISIVLLGDSYSSGNGAGNYYGIKDAYRSSDSWAHKYISWLNSNGVKTTFTNLSFSGSTTNGVIKEQIQNVPSSTNLVMLTIGGNDANFADVVGACYSVARNPYACKMYVENAQKSIPELIKNTEEIFKKLEEKLPDDARIVLVGYPLLSLDKEYNLFGCENFTAISNETGCIKYSVTKNIRNLGEVATTSQEALVKNWNSHHTLKATFVSSISTAFNTHEPDPALLSKNDYRWTNEFLETEGATGANGKTSSKLSIDKNTWYHPNKTGHEMIAKEVIKTVGVPSNAENITTTNSPVDVAFVVDTTSSMVLQLAWMREKVNETIADLRSKSSSVRFALVSYRDHPSWAGDKLNYPYKVNQDFTTDEVSFRRQLNLLSAMGGGDENEAVFSGTMAALNLDWRVGVRKVMIIIGDAGAKDPEPVTGYTWRDVKQRALEVDPVSVYAIDTGNLSNSSVVLLAHETGGRTFYSTRDEIPETISSVVTLSTSNPYVWIQGPYVVKVGDSATIDARGSYAVSNEIIKYEWDFNNDGIYDRESTDPMITQAFGEEYSGLLVLKVTDSSGNWALGSTQLDVTNDGDITPRESDNCPDIYNYSQSDYDNDGIGDECDSDSGFPAAGQAGVYEITDDGKATEYGYAWSNSGSELIVGILELLTYNPKTNTVTPTSNEGAATDAESQKLLSSNSNSEPRDRSNSPTRQESPRSYVIYLIALVVMVSAVVVVVRLIKNHSRKL